MTEILIAVVGLFAGAVVAWLWRGWFATARVGPLEQLLAEKVREIDALKAEHARAAESLRTESERRIAAQERLAVERRAAEEKLALLNDAQQKLSDAFKALSSEALKSNNQAFLDLTKGAYAELSRR